MNNLNRYLSQLNAAKNPQCVHAGYLHPEPKGIVAVDQSAGGPSLQETRLYLYPCNENNVLHVITIGNKAEQSEDIKLSGHFADRIRKTLEPRKVE